MSGNKIVFSYEDNENNKKINRLYDENKKLVAENEALKEEIFNLKCEMAEYE